MIYFGYWPLINMIRAFTLQIYTILRNTAHVLEKNILMCVYFGVKRSRNDHLRAAWRFCRGG